MDCKSCNAEIDPRWKHATESNMCPFCGSKIMDDELRIMLETLRATIESAEEKNYGAQVRDWFSSNYGLILKDDIKDNLSDEDKQELINIGIKQAKEEFANSVFNKHTNSVEDDSEENGVLIDAATDERTSEFLKRAGVTTKDGESVAEKTQRLKSERTNARKNIKELVDQIQSGEVSSQNSSNVLESVVLYPDQEPNVDEHSDIIVEDEDVPSHVLAMAASSSGITDPNINTKDLLIHNRMKNKRRGTFKGGKNGFTRS